MSDVAVYHVLFVVQGGMWTGYSQVCGLAIASPHTALHWKQYMICCHITHNIAIFIILIRDFSYLYILITA